MNTSEQPASPFFSIVIPAYNRGELIVETLESVMGQTHADWECIVVDDGSTDNTREVVKKIADRDSRVRYIHQENAERSAARNNGIPNARGHYICFLDSDDRYAPSYLEVLHGFIGQRGHPVALIVSRFCLWDGKVTTRADVPEISGNVAEWLFTYPVSPSRACVHRSILDTFRFREDIVMVEDSVLWCSIASEFPVLLQPECLVWYRVHDGNSVNRASKASFLRYDGLQKFMSSPFSSSLSGSMKRHLLSDVRFRMAEYHRTQGDHWKALSMVLRSLLTAPLHRHTKAKVFMVLQMVPGFNLLWNSR